MAFKNKFRLGGHTKSEQGSKSDVPKFLRAFRPHKAKEVKAQTDRDARMDYRLNKPLTQQNIEQQKVFTSFEWVYKSRRNSGLRASIAGSNISPGVSRHSSIDSGRAPSFEARRASHRLSIESRRASRRLSMQQTRASLLVNQVPIELPGEESDHEEGQGHLALKLVPTMVVVEVSPDDD